MPPSSLGPAAVAPGRQRPVAGWRGGGGHPLVVNHDTPALLIALRALDEAADMIAEETEQTGTAKSDFARRIARVSEIYIPAHRLQLYTLDRCYYAETTVRYIQYRSYDHIPML